MKKLPLKLFIGVASILMASSCLASCGGSSSTASSSLDDGSKNVEIIFWHCFGQSIVEGLNKKIEKFTALVKKNENVNLTITASSHASDYGTLLTQVTNGYTVGNTPTMAVAYPDHVAEFLDYDNFVVNLDQYINSAEYTFGTDAYYGDNIAGTEDFVQAFYQEGSNYMVEGTYSMPLMKSTELMYYNKDVVENVLAPKYKDPDESVSQFMNSLTWQEFSTMLQDVRDDIDNNDGETYGSALKTPCYYDSDSNLFISQCFQRGIDYLGYDKEQKTGKVLFNNEQARAMVKEFKDMFGDSTGTQSLFWTKGSNNGAYGSDSFKNREVLFSIGSSGGTGYQDPKGAFNVGICPVPSYSGNMQYVTQGPSICILNNLSLSNEVNAERALYAWKFLKYLTSTDVNVDMCSYSQGYVPVRISSTQTEDYQAYLEETDLTPRSSKAVIEKIDGHYFNAPVFKGSAKARDAVGGIVTQVLLGNKTIEEAFNDAENQVKLQMKGGN